MNTAFLLFLNYGFKVAVAALLYFIVFFVLSRLRRRRIDLRLFVLFFLLCLMAPSLAMLHEHYIEDGIVGAAGTGKYDEVRSLLFSGADVNVVIGEGYEDTPLMAAIEAKDLKMVKILVEAGADMNQVVGRAVEEQLASKRLNPLQVAGQKAPEITEYLRQHGAR